MESTMIQFEQELINHCSPVLAGLKSANLMNLPVQDSALFLATLSWYQSKLEPKGVSIRLLRHGKGKALVYVYRERMLHQELQKAGVSDFLAKQGYPSMELEQLLCHLGKRIQRENTFPHEIGLFLGYPLHDVVGFIENDGKNCCCIGVWKVYDCVCEAQKLFAKFKKCRAVYTQQFSQGKSLLHLTVAA